MKRFQAFSFFVEIEERPYLDLPLQGLDVIDDLIQHYRLPGDLNQIKSIPRKPKCVILMKFTYQEQKTCVQLPFRSEGSLCCNQGQGLAEASSSR
jgi:hypothetical protein